MKLLGVSSRVQDNMIIDIFVRDMITMPNKNRPIEHSNTIPASSAWTPTRATKSLAILGLFSLLLGFCRTSKVAKSTQTHISIC